MKMQLKILAILVIHVNSCDAMNQPASSPPIRITPHVFRHDRPGPYLIEQLVIDLYNQSKLKFANQEEYSKFTQQVIFLYNLEAAAIARQQDFRQSKIKSLDGSPKYALEKKILFCYENFKHQQQNGSRIAAVSMSSLPSQDEMRASPAPTSALTAQLKQNTNNVELPFEMDE